MRRISKGGKLLTLAPKGFRRYRHTDDTGHVETAKADGMPLPTWPNGSWCFEVALYLNSALSNLSMSSRGGSYASIAYMLCHLIRYCYKNKIGFLEMTDSKFTMFINNLSAKEQHPDGSVKTPRLTRRTLQIGRRALGFLSYIGNFYGRPNFVAPEGTIRGFMKTMVRKSTRKGGRDKVVHYWHHDSFPEASPKNRRHPINDEYISRLRQAVVTLHRSPYLRQRRFVLIRLLDATGGRRIELANLTTAAVAEAQAMVDSGEAPFLRLPTFKKRGGTPMERFVPIDEVTLTALINFIRIYRAPVIEKVGFDCGFLLLSIKGTKLEPNTLTLELHLLRKAAGIQGKAHPHLFRHRYCSKRVARLLSGTDFKDTASVIAYLLKAGAEMKKLLEETGHASVESLRPYIDDHFMALNNPQQAVEGPDLSRLSASVQTSAEELSLMQGKIPAEELAHLAINEFQAYASGLKRLTQPAG